MRAIIDNRCQCHLQRADGVICSFAVSLYKQPVHADLAVTIFHYFVLNVP